MKDALNRFLQVGDKVTIMVTAGRHSFLREGKVVGLKPETNKVKVQWIEREVLVRRLFNPRNVAKQKVH